MAETKLTDKQEAFISWYCRTLNAADAARRAGYAGNDITLANVGCENLGKPYIRAEIDRRLRAFLPSADDVLGMITATATMDITPYTRENGTIDVQALGRDGLGRLVTGVKPGRNGPEVTLQDPQTAQKMLARYHRLLDQHVELDVKATANLDSDALASLAEQIAIAQQSATDTSDD